MALYGRRGGSSRQTGRKATSTPYPPIHRRRFRVRGAPIQTTSKKSQRTNTTCKSTKHGLQPGHEKVGGRQKPFDLSKMKVRERNAYLLGYKDAHVICENIIRKATGRKHLVIGPTGKRLWRATPPEQQFYWEKFWADIAFAKPRLNEVSGSDGEPIRREANDLSPSESARRLAFLLMKHDRDSPTTSSRSSSSKATPRNHGY